jgi:hypothetical protein
MGKPSKEVIIKAIKGSGGVMSTIAKKLNVDWHTAKSYVKLYPETRQAYKNEEEFILDIADAKLYDNVKQGDLAAIKWLQATKGKKRGYVERSEITGKNGNAIQAKTKTTLDYSKLPAHVKDAILAAAGVDGAINTDA